MNEITIEKAKEIVINSAKEYGKIITKIEENDEYWKFTAEFEDGHKNLDNGAGGVYISKKDGSVKGLDPWDVEFGRKFFETSKVIYNYRDK